MAISFLRTPEAIALFGVNPRWVGVETDADNTSLLCELKVEKKVGMTYTEINRLISPYTNGEAWFNVSKLPYLSYDLPSVGSISAYEANEVTNLRTEYRLTARELLNDVQQGTALTFSGWALRGAVEPLLARDYVFYEQKHIALTNRPQTSRVMKDMPNWLYVLNARPTGNWNQRLYVNLYFSDGSETLGHLIEQYATTQMGNCWALAIGFTQLDLASFETASKVVIAYEVWSELFSTPAILQPQLRSTTFRYEIDFEATEYSSQHIIFQNSKGGIDVVRCSGKSSTKLQQERDTSKLVTTHLSTSDQHITTTDMAASRREVVANLGWLSTDERAWLRDLATCRIAWLVSDGFIPITITSVSIEDKDDEELLDGSLTYIEEVSEA